MAKLTLETARKMYLEGGAGKDFVLDNFSEDELTKKELPKRFEDLGIIAPNWIYDSSEKYIALWHLEQYVKAYNGNWVADWTGSNQIKWCIYFLEEEIVITPFDISKRFLSFKSKDLAEQFLENFKDLIETAKPLL